MAAPKFLVALMLILAIFSGMAQAQAIPPAVLADIQAKCGTAMGALLQYGPACYTASAKPLKKCPAACATLINSVPSADCSTAVFNATPVANRGRVAKVCSQIYNLTILK